MIPEFSVVPKVLSLSFNEIYTPLSHFKRASSFIFLKYKNVSFDVSIVYCAGDFETLEG